MQLLLLLLLDSFSTAQTTKLSDMIQVNPDRVKAQVGTGREKPALISVPCALGTDTLPQAPSSPGPTSQPQLSPESVELLVGWLVAWLVGCLLA